MSTYLPAPGTCRRNGKLLVSVAILSDPDILADPDPTLKILYRYATSEIKGTGMLSKFVLKHSFKSD
jgi:hypothetical protein